YFHERKIQRRMMKNSSMNKPVTLLINNEDYCESARLVLNQEIPYSQLIGDPYRFPYSFSALLISSAALVYSHVEEWAYIEALYFCFISFATIGFGDYVSNQKDVTNINGDVYRCVALTKYGQEIRVVAAPVKSLAQYQHYILILNCGRAQLGCCCFCSMSIQRVVDRRTAIFELYDQEMIEEEDLLCLKKRPTKYMG
ncbi:Ion channel, partial [Cooperia oncophora]